MSVLVKFIGGTPEEDGRYEDGEGREYRYAPQENGALAIYEKETGESIPPEEQPIAIYGPAAWFSVSGDKLTRSDRRAGRVSGY
ncbi:hypothetical protein ACFVTT_34020 [Streptomyces niveus]|uniref:hypothetical protein n=1 Tax=Streptomyces niveus TaxID=193462 RepID=UPI0034164582